MIDPAHFDSASPEPPSKRKLAWGTLAALVVAGVLLVTVVIPAEYGIDPLGTGEALGLVVLSDPSPADIPVRSDGLVPQPEAYRIDRRVLEIAPGEFAEYKFRLEAGEAMVYTWTATDSVLVEMHSEADGAPEGTAEFFEVLEAAVEGAGSYVAPFPGDHGWAWTNEGEEAVTVTLHASGFFSDAIEYPAGADPILHDMTTTPRDAYPEAAAPGAPGAGQEP